MDRDGHRESESFLRTLGSSKSIETSLSIPESVAVDDEKFRETVLLSPRRVRDLPRLVLRGPTRRRCQERIVTAWLGAPIQREFAALENILLGLFGHTNDLSFLSDPSNPSFPS